MRRGIWIMKTYMFIALSVIGLIIGGRYYIKFMRKKIIKGRNQLRAEFRQAIENNEINKTNEEGYTYLMLGIMGKFDKLTKEMIKNVSDINFRGPVGETALHHAAHFSDEEIIDLMLERGADPSLKDDGNCTPLWFAAQNNKAKIVKRLLEEKIDIDVKDKQFEFTPLMIAAQNGNYEIAELLVAAGADKEITSDQGTAYDIAKLRLNDNIKRLKGDSEEQLKNMINQLEVE